MYSIIGGDGKEYGPVTVEQVRAWMAGGRANFSTRVKAAGSDAWKTIAECPEITGVGPAVGPAAVPAPAGVPVRTPQARTPVLDVMSCYERSWKLLKADFWPLVGVSLVITLIHYAISRALGLGELYAGLILSGLLGSGLFYYFLLRIRGRPAKFGDAFAGFTKAFFPLFVIGLVASVFITVGLVCVLIPGIYLAVAYVFYPVLSVDKGLDFWETMELSRRVVTKNWWRVLGLLLLFIPFLLLGIVALLVGVFVAIPFITGAYVYAYEDLFNPGK